MVVFVPSRRAIKPEAAPLLTASKSSVPAVRAEEARTETPTMEPAQGTG